MGHATSGVNLSTVRYGADAGYRLFVVEDCYAGRETGVHQLLKHGAFPQQAVVAWPVPRRLYGRWAGPTGIGAVKKGWGTGKEDSLYIGYILDGRAHLLHPLRVYRAGDDAVPLQPGADNCPIGLSQQRLCIVGINSAANQQQPVR